MHSCRKKNQCQTWFSYKSCKIFGSHSAKCLTYIFLYKNTELKNIRLSSTPDAYYISDSKSIKGAWYNCFNLFFARYKSLLFLNWGRSVPDIDECSEVYGVKMNNCHLNASCVNTQGSYNCSCNPTYFGNGSTCEGKFVQIFDKRRHKSLSPNTLRNYCHSWFYANFNHI